jgi:hypothetical protein
LDAAAASDGLRPCCALSALVRLFCRLMSIPFSLFLCC